MENRKQQIEWLIKLMAELENDALNGQCNLCGIVATQSKLIKLMQAELESMNEVERKVA